MDSSLHLQNYMDVTADETSLRMKAAVAVYEYYNEIQTATELTTVESESTHQDDTTAPDSPAVSEYSLPSFAEDNDISSAASSPVASTSSWIFSPIAFSERSLPSPPSSDSFQDEVTAGLGMTGVDFAEAGIEVESVTPTSSPLTQIAVNNKECAKWRSTVGKKAVEPVVKRKLEVEEKKPLVKSKGKKNEEDIYLVSITELHPTSAIASARNILVLTPTSPNFNRQTLNQPFTFTSAPSEAYPVSVEWTVVFPSLSASFVTSSVPASHLVFKFHHFAPSTAFVHPSHEIGSGEWWRLQYCEVGHGSKCPGHWDPTGKRPARVVDHLAGCGRREKMREGNALGGLARAVQEGFVGGTKRKRACEK